MVLKPDDHPREAGPVAAERLPCIKTKESHSIPVPAYAQEFAGRIHAVGWEDAVRLSLCGRDAPAAIETTEERAMYELLTGFNDIYDAYRRRRL